MGDHERPIMQEGGFIDSDWLQMRYRDFYDFPRAFVVEQRGELFFFDCPFDERLDDYSNVFRVYRLPVHVRRELDTMSWELLSRVGQLIGKVSVSSVEFDESKRGAIRARIFDKIDSDSQIS